MHPFDHRSAEKPACPFPTRFAVANRFWKGRIWDPASGVGTAEMGRASDRQFTPQVDHFGHELEILRADFHSCQE